MSLIDSFFSYSQNIKRFVTVGSKINDALLSQQSYNFHKRLEYLREEFQFREPAVAACLILIRYRLNITSWY